MTMKRIIVIDQELFSKTDLDLKDIVILDYLKSVYLLESDKATFEIREKGMTKIYIKINFNKVIRDLPLLRIKQKASISERIKKLEKLGYLKCWQAPDSSLYIRLGPKTLELDFVKEAEKPLPKPEPQKIDDIYAPEEVSALKVRSPGVKEVIKLYSELCASMKGFKPTIDWGADAMMVKRRLSELSIDELKEAFEWYLGSNLFEKLGASLKTALSAFVLNNWKAQRNQ